VSTVPAIGHDCWNRIGIRGDGSCADLARHVHCRNCPVYSAAAQALLDRPLSDDELVDRTRHVSRPKTIDEPGTQTVIIFRVAEEWLALPMTVVTEVTEVRPIHSLPHRRGGPLLGVANVRGALLVCVSLARLLGLEEAREPAAEPRGAHKRLLVLRRDDLRAVCQADEIHGVHRVHTWELSDVPETVGKAAARHSTAVILWRDYAVGLLDDQLLFHALQRSLA